MRRDLGGRGRLVQRWSARLALIAGLAAVVILLVVAGFKSIALLGAGLAGLAISAASLWWALTRRGIGRLLAFTLAAVAPLAVLALYAWAELLWVVLVSLALWALGVSVGVATLSRDIKPAGPLEMRTAPPQRPFLIMNPRSGGGKVGKFHLKEKAEALDADVLLLDTAHQQDVVALADKAVEDGADLLGVAGGDGTQALVAGVAARHGIPFMVISAGTRNHFALDLGLDRDDPSTCLDALADGVELRVDIGFIGERAFVNNASFGTYAAVVQSPAYRDDKVRTVLQTLPDLLTHRRGPRLAVRAADTVLDGPQAVLVSNNPYRMGDLAGLGRREVLDSGALGVLGVNVDNAAQAAELLTGRHAPGLTTLTTQEVVVDADAPEIEAGVDGEALTLPTPVRCTIHPRALRVRVPRHRPGVPRTRAPMDWRRLRKLALS
ncbi:diacylglycerol/lipid kinase family protein [Streptomyces europaeiscabiei]|uniref:diacylglycerol/lipid kinase family protein n=1 Tax=Streptomyces europaeiscabiei TaxID=146819 RepID=UPI0006286A97|nr:diacylglycerol kinase family protein [Streptomyces europaeiscabiei]MDX3667718.1 diacylglycerol kinase family protein [Streptomyces europaeiscabiei]MDX3708444.1 diacylglycerol kinase family protein [Streptomyces europaeiscabiei]MDX3834455.1 diacylglycerol kinase family protein [Streptomyces europaeiscabiei]MDX3860627.1 diacylglycerol kinase family protein [Streptomyces europaeiscabiei]MDX3869238.1 diacylglycerol kinase family protein [Streptomyces europaeiscabiei]